MGGGVLDLVDVYVLRIWEKGRRNKWRTELLFREINY